MSAPRLETYRVRFGRARLVRRLSAIAVALVVLPLPVLGLAALALGRLGVSGAWVDDALTCLWLASLPVAVAAAVVPRFDEGGPGTLRVEGGELVVTRGDDERRIAVAALREGFASPFTREVELVRRDGERLRARVEDAEAARALLAAAGLDATRRTVRMALGETTFLDALSILLGPLVVVPVLGALARVLPPRSVPGQGAARMLLFYALFVALMALVFRGMRALFGPAEVVVGADGVIVRRLGRDRFVAFDELTGVDVGRDRVELAVRGGRAVRARARHLVTERREQLRARIDEAWTAWRRGADDAEAPARLSRRGRDLAAWRVQLGRVVASVGRYRDSPLEQERVVRVREDASAPVGTRLGAALALAELGGEARERVRIAARAAANPRVRVLLGAVAAGTIDDATLEAATAEEAAPPGRGAA
jgi:hypothetical protein